MHHFAYARLVALPIDADLRADLDALHDAKRQQDHYLLTQASTLDHLAQIAKVRSITASNAIEHLYAADTRLLPLLNEQTMPRNADEAQIVGYRDALQIIHQHYPYLTVTPNSILQLHQVLFSRTGFGNGGKFKDVPNYVATTDAQGQQHWFTPTDPTATPAAVAELCEQFNQALTANVVDPLLLIAVFVRDFLCIHPLADGNGRVSRLLTTLLLLRAGYLVDRYVAVAEPIAQTVTDYYAALSQAQAGWHDDADDPTPFIKYLLRTLRTVYADLTDRLVIPTDAAGELAVVQKAITKTRDPFTKADLREFCPHLADVTIAKHLAALSKRGVIAKHGTTKATYYTHG